MSFFEGNHEENDLIEPKVVEIRSKDEGEDDEQCDQYEECNNREIPLKRATGLQKMHVNIDEQEPEVNPLYRSEDYMTYDRTDIRKEFERQNDSLSNPSSLSQGTAIKAGSGISIVNDKSISLKEEETIALSSDISKSGDLSMVDDSKQQSSCNFNTIKKKLLIPLEPDPKQDEAIVEVLPKYCKEFLKDEIFPPLKKTITPELNEDQYYPLVQIEDEVIAKKSPHLKKNTDLARKTSNLSKTIQELKKRSSDVPKSKLSLFKKSSCCLKNDFAKKSFNFFKKLEEKTLKNNNPTKRYIDKSEVEQYVESLDETAHSSKQDDKPCIVKVSKKEVPAVARNYLQHLENKTEVEGKKNNFLRKEDREHDLNPRNHNKTL